MKIFHANGLKLLEVGSRRKNSRSEKDEFFMESDTGRYVHGLLCAFLGFLFFAFVGWGAESYCRLGANKGVKIHCARMGPDMTKR